MARIDAQDMENGFPSDSSDRRFLPGQGTMHDPYQANAMEDTVTELARIAAVRKEPVYCQFEGSNFRINPDGTFERAHRMPPLRDNVEQMFQETLAKIRGTMGA